MGGAHISVRGQGRPPLEAIPQLRDALVDVVVVLADGEPRLEGKLREVLPHVLYGSVFREEASAKGEGEGAGSSQGLGSLLAPRQPRESNTLRLRPKP